VCRALHGRIEFVKPLAGQARLGLRQQQDDI
jgi:hypothetical protein